MFLFYDPLFFFFLVFTEHSYSVFVYLIMTSESTKLRGKKGKNMSHGAFQRNIVRPRTMRNPAQNNKSVYESNIFDQQHFTETEASKKSEKSGLFSVIVTPLSRALLSNN